MKKSILIIFIGLFLAFSVVVGHCDELTLNNTPVQVYFSPNGGCTDAIVKEIGNAKSEILVQAYNFTSTPIAKSLLEAHKRGVKVEAILDKSQRKQNYSSATFLANSRIPTFIDDAHAIAHNKIMIIDGTTVITGSFNFTKAAEIRNAENLLIIKSPELAKLYIENWNHHREHSESYAPRD
jgi:phosphatidylserine/phosphatidylglycerophosphate/cardiolipin synthase-like enzyme